MLRESEWWLTYAMTLEATQKDSGPAGGGLAPAYHFYDCRNSERRIDADLQAARGDKGQYQGPSHRADGPLACLLAHVQGRFPLTAAQVQSTIMKDEYISILTEIGAARIQRFA